METLLETPPPINLHDAAKEAVRLLDNKPPTPERAAHKFKMIRAAEITADAYRRTGQYEDERLDAGAAWLDVEAAIKFCEAA